MTRLSNRLRCQLSVAAAILLPSLVFSETETTDPQTISSSKEAPSIEKSWCETPPDWQFRIVLPGWVAGLSGESGVKGVVDATDVSFDQLLHHLTHLCISKWGGGSDKLLAACDAARSRATSLVKPLSQQQLTNESA